MRIAAPDSAVTEIASGVASFVSGYPGMLIGGLTRPALSGATMPVFNPATGEQLAQVPRGGAADVNLAVEAAREAFPRWSRTAPVERQRLLWRLADLLEENGEEFAQLETLNQGKSIMMSRLVEVSASAEYLRYMAGWATKIEGTTFDVSIPVPPGARYQAQTRREPVGVVAAVTPWNFPLGMAVWKLAPALACGCTVVLKPAEETPLTSIRLVELCREAGFPDGVVNIVTGTGAEAGAPLVAHPVVRKITFTGSTEIGKKIGIAAVTDMKRLTLELGGKAPMIMFEDMDLDRLGIAAGIGIFFNSGQTCCAGTRVYAQRRVFDRVLETLSGIAGSISIGPGLDPAHQLNPMVSSKHQASVRSAMDAARRSGATPVLGNSVHEGPGFFVRPEIFIDTDQSMPVMQEEIFGPVVTVTPFDTEEEAVALANDTRYGLSASVWTTNLNTANRMAANLEAGTVWINIHNLPDQAMPFGGYKQSGLGREHGRGGLDNYLETKSICVAL